MITTTATTTSFIAFYAGREITIEATSLWDAKKKAIKILGVPNSKTGLVSVMSVNAYKNEEFRYGN